jgi:hypothetical protein
MNISTLLVLVVVMGPPCGWAVLIFPPEEHDMLKCLVNISKTYFLERSTIVVSISEENSVPPQTPGDKDSYTSVHGLSTALIQELQFLALWTIIVHDTRKNYAFLMIKNKHKLSYILLLDSRKGIRGFLTQFHHLTNLTYINSRDLFTVAVVNNQMEQCNTPEEREFAREILMTLWQYGIVNAIVLVQGTMRNPWPVWNGSAESASDYFTLQVYTWFPYNSDRCEASAVDTVLLDQWIKTERQYFLLGASLFPSKALNDLHGCPVNISTLPWEPFVLPLTIPIKQSKVTQPRGTYNTYYNDGVEIRLINCLASKMNFTTAYRPSRNGSFGLFLQLITQQSELAFGGLISTPKAYKTFDATISYLRETYVWFVPHAKPGPHWTSLVMIFETPVWCLVFTAYILGSFAIYILANVKHVTRREFNGYRKLVSCCFYTLHTLLGLSVAVKPRSWPVRVSFLMWVLFSLEINTAYQSSLISFLTEPPPLPVIRTVDELLTSGLKYGTTNRSFNNFDTSEDPQFQRILQKLEFNDNFTALLDRMAFHGDLAVAGGKAHTSFLRDTHYVLKGKRLFIAIKESISSNGIVMYLRKGSPLLDRYNTIIFRVIEAGLVNKWWEDVTHKPSRNEDQDFDDEEDKDGDGDEDHYDSRKKLSVLSLSHLQGAFCLWVVGLGMALVVYVIEIMSGRDHNDSPVPAVVGY